MNRQLELHRAAMTSCRRCGHGDTVQPIVSIARSPRAMLVGQAPGRVEAAGGPPFSGRAGRTLFAWFASVGLDEESLRTRMYIAAITRCYPGAHPSGRGDRVPSGAERHNCANWLDSELRIIKPRLIIPVGRLAIDAFLGPVALDRVIGKEHELTGARRALVIPLPHPSGASSWIHVLANKSLLHQALALIANRWLEQLPGRRVA